MNHENSPAAPFFSPQRELEALKVDATAHSHSGRRFSPLTYRLVLMFINQGLGGKTCKTRDVIFFLR